MATQGDPRARGSSYRKYAPEALQLALLAVLKGEMGNNKAAKHYGVPRQTISDQVRHYLAASKAAGARTPAKAAEMAVAALETPADEPTVHAPADKQKYARTALTVQQEKAVEKIMLEYSKWGMSLDRSEITTLVLKVLGKARSKGKHPAAAKWGKDGVVSRKWLQGFLRRHPSIAPVLITSE